MSDLIDKQAAIDAMQKLIIADDEEGLMLMEYNQAVTDCIDKVAELPPVEQKQGWIPVSERLPDKLQDVVVTFYDAEGECDIAYMRKTFNASYKAQGSENEWVSSMGETTYADYEVSAWMPLPEPYKASPTGAEKE